jgi:hypothetical protein
MGLHWSVHDLKVMPQKEMSRAFFLEFEFVPLVLYLVFNLSHNNELFSKSIIVEFECLSM